MPPGQETSGRFIAFEGGEGCGKSTQARLLVDALTARGIGAVLTREPGGTPGAEAIRALLLDPPGDGWGAEAEALLFAAARADHGARLIRPAMAEGTTTSRCPSRAKRAPPRATSRMRSVLPMEVPPYFCTIKAILSCQLSVLVKLLVKPVFP